MFFDSLGLSMKLFSETMIKGDISPKDSTFVSVG